jgi:hypothetical protein
VTPEVPELEVTGGGGINLTGKFRGLGTYTIEVDAGVRDTYGQTLAKPWRGTVTLQGAGSVAGRRRGDARPGGARAVAPRGARPQGGGADATSRCARSSSDGRRAAGDDPGARGYYDDEWMEPLQGATSKTFQVAESRAEAMTLPLATREMATMPGNFLLLGARSNKVGDYDWKYRLSLNYVVEVTRSGQRGAGSATAG